MADSKITALTSIGASTDPANDPLVLVDVSDTSMAASGTTKKVTLNQLLGASGTATLASATITGDLTVATDRLKVTGGNVGIGTATPTNYANYTTLTINGTNGGEIDLTDGGTLRGQLFSESTGLTLAAVGGLIKFGAGTGGTEKMRIDSSGNVGVGVTPSGSGGCLQLKSGITFPATQVASSDANTLDDYEEGIWTGTLKGSVSDPTTPVTATGRYTKIGRVVTVQIGYENVITTGASGDISISGLPFSNSSAIRTLGSAGSLGGAVFTGTLVSELGNASTSINFQSINSNASWSAATHSAGSFRYFWAELTYTV